MRLTPGPAFELVVWHVHVGESVAEDQALADVMTDKASDEIPSPVAGRVLALGGEVGQTMAVGSELIRIEVENMVGAAAAVQPPSAVKHSPAAVTHASKPVTPAVDRPALAQATPPLSARAPASPQPGAQSPGTERPIASPALRRRAWELGINLKQVPASGTAGRVAPAWTPWAGSAPHR